MTEVAPARPAFDRIGAVALAIGVLGLLVGAAIAFAQPLAIRSGGIPVLQVLSAVRLMLGAMLGLAAVAIGLLALLRRRPRSATGAAGTALGATLLLEVLVGALQPLLFAGLSG